MEETNPPVKQFRFYLVRIKTYQELRLLASEETDDGMCINGTWYLKELEETIADLRNIVVFEEDDYFVHQTLSKDEYRITMDMIAEVISTITDVPTSWDISDHTSYLTRAKPYATTGSVTWSDISVNKSTTVINPELIDPFADAPTHYRKKPKSKNTQPLENGDLCLIDGLAIPQVITNVDNAGVTVSGSTQLFKKAEVFPIFELNSSAEPQLGDIVKTRSRYVLLTTAELIDIAIRQKFSLIFRHTNVEDKLIPRSTINRYPDGVYTDVNGSKIEDNRLEGILNNRFKPNINDINESYEIEVIAKHYGINKKDVKPKEVKILKTLEIILDHPEFVKDGEWALLVGPSGSGKTTIAVEYAEIKGLDYVLQCGSAQLTVDDLLGYNSITTGQYFPSLLRGAIENGRVFILDEIDACNPNTLLCLNAFKRGEVQFPDKLVKVHPNFRFIATANTLMYSEDYNGRSAMDRATIKRFSTLFYDLTKAELAVRYGFEATKGLMNLLTAKKAYTDNEYDLVHGCILQSKSDLDPRDIQRRVLMDRLTKDGVFK